MKELFLAAFGISSKRQEYGPNFEQLNSPPFSNEGEAVELAASACGWG
jgi:hypothetical protein